MATLTMGHPSKNGNGSARGAGAQEDAGDVNLTLTMHRGEINDQNGVIALRVTKNRLLGHVPPLFLRRIGDDQFAPVTAEEACAGATVPEVKPKKADKCADDILGFLAKGEATFTAIWKEMVSLLHAETTAKRTIKRLQKEGLIEHNGLHYLLSATN